ncbi:glycosyltransferase family 2 protein [Curtobacterium aetherium]|uniref:glycosyltransferase n=1 Tax=Curtobacterium aetherium TaxID=2841594 RepID=UPI003B52D802
MSVSPLTTSLSVVVPAHDSAPWIAELLESVLAQDVEAMEVLVVENGSTDDTAAIVAAAAASDPRVRLLSSRAGSAAAARNEGVAAATGEYLVFADADDIVPDGAYRTMLETITASGSDMVVGDHLKFSPTATWSPTARWHLFDGPARTVTPAEAPALLSGRACWNRVFRRSSWDRAGLRFPEVPSVEDIEPMTRAVTAATSVDVVPACVYLYRDRGDTSSLSLRADAAVTVRYLEQELRCAELVAGDPALRRQHAEVVLDADGWAHLHRFLLTDPDAEATRLVAAALAPLVAAVGRGGLATVAPHRRVLWLLVLADAWNVAARFVRGTATDDPTERADAWTVAFSALQTSGETAAEDVAALVADGLLPALVNTADAADPERVAAWTPRLRDLPLPSDADGLVGVMAEAVRSGGPQDVADAARLRHVVPLVVDGAEPTAAGLVLTGPLRTGTVPPGLTLVLSDGAVRVPLTTDTAAGRWRADVDGVSLPAGRHTVSVVAAVADVRLPVVTARMPLPPLPPTAPLQPLADRRDGWRFLVDRRAAPERGLASALRRVARRLR